MCTVQYMVLTPHVSIDELQQVESPPVNIDELQQVEYDMYCTIHGSYSTC